MAKKVVATLKKEGGVSMTKVIEDGQVGQAGNYTFEGGLDSFPRTQPRISSSNLGQTDIRIATVHSGFFYSYGFFSSKKDQE